SIALYSFGYFLWQFANNEAYALFWFRILIVGIILINVTYLHFVFAFLEILHRKRKFLIACYAINFMFILLNLSSLLYTRLVPRHGLGFWPIPTNLFHVYLSFWFFQLFYGFNFLLKGYRKASGFKREQIRYFLAAAIVGFLGGTTNWPMWYNIHFPPYMNILISVSLGIVAYAIVTYRLMDINVAVTKTAIFTTIYSIFLGIPPLLLLLHRSFLYRHFGVYWWLIPAGVVVCELLAFVAPSINHYFQERANKVLLKKQRIYQQNLIDLAKQMTLTKDLRGLLVLIIRNVTREIGISHARIYLLDNKANEYVREVHYGKERRRQFGDSLPNDAPLVQMLYRSRDIGPLLKEEVISHFETREPEHLKEVEAQLRSMGAAVLLPAFIGEELITFLVLGTKRSREIYTPDDLGMFKILAGQSALAIENALFYQELKESQSAMVQASKLSSLGELAAGFAHQIDNPLAIISAGCELCIRDIKEWLGKRDLPENEKKVLEEMKDRMEKVIDTDYRAADLVQRIKGYAKPSEKDFEPVDLNSVMETVLILAQYNISRGGINVTKDIPQDLPRIKGLGVHVEQVFLNMIINACEAMAGKKGELTISARVGSDNPDRIEVAVADNGCGIPQENLKKLFDLFFTTKGPQGTGMGLSMAYRIIKDLNGDIDIESEVGKGTRFTVSLPIWEEKKT
ncbi:GAF domain-containing protein, partial [bacterium]|nr:GAF domain-containing protein [bacterium]